MEQLHKNSKSHFPANGFLEAATTCRLSAGLNPYAYGFFRRLLWCAPVLQSALNRMCLRSTRRAKLLNDQATYVTKNQRMCEAQAQGLIFIQEATAAIADGRMVTLFANKRRAAEREFACIMLCIGYKQSFPFLDLASFNGDPRSWYLHCMPADQGEALFFLGFARPHQGGIPVLAEMLSRIIALKLCGKAAFPSFSAKDSEQQVQEQDQYYYLSPHVRTLVDYSAIMTTAARHIGCEPRLPTACILLFNLHMWRISLLPFLDATSRAWCLLLCASLFICMLRYDHCIMIKFWFLPQWPVWFRLRGPGSGIGGWQDTMRSIPIRRDIEFSRGFLLFLAWCLPARYVQWLLSPAIYVLEGFANLLCWGGTSCRLSMLRPKFLTQHGGSWKLTDFFHP